jgi:hypothetical protein
MTLLTLEYNPNYQKRDFFMSINTGSVRPANALARFRFLRQAFAYKSWMPGLMSGLMTALLLMPVTANSFAASMVKKNGFLIDAPLVSERAIILTGQARDGIPSIDQPEFIPASEALYLEPKERVLGLSFKGETKAYPLRFLNFHEIVNDNFRRHPVVITYCPLCGAGMAFDALMGGQAFMFGVSGLLYNSDLVMFDRNTGSLWSQISTLAINGAHKGSRLTQLPLENTTWEDWQKRHPQTWVLSASTGYWRDYASSPYPGYANAEHLYFPVANLDTRYPSKTLALGVEQNGKARVYPFPELENLSQEMPPPPAPSNRYQFTDRMEGEPLSIDFDPVAKTAIVTDADGNIIPSVILYWFAWMAFYPKAEVYVAP